MIYAAGIDVSNHNAVIDWGNWRGQAFAFTKATEGTGYRDPYFGRNWAGMASVGLVRGAYGFAHPVNDPAEDARFFLDYIRTFGLRDTDLFALDLEVDGGLSPQQVSAFAQAWCRWIRAHVPNRLLVYTYRNFAAQGNCAGLGGYPLWIADPDALPGQPRVPAPWNTWHIHQHGIIGGIDRNVFNGDQAALKTFASGGNVSATGPESWDATDWKAFHTAVFGTGYNASGWTLGGTLQEMKGTTLPGLAAAIAAVGAKVDAEVDEAAIAIALAPVIRAAIAEAGEADADTIAARVAAVFAGKLGT